MIGIIDYGAGNIFSVQNALDFLEQEYLIVDKPELLDNVKKIIFPGVGSFGAMIRSLEKKNLKSKLIKKIKEGIPYFGICLGYQALFERSEEDPDVEGLAIFEGNVVRFTEGKIPQIGWNNINVRDSASVYENGYVYYVNSYYPVPKDEKIIATTTDYYGEFASAIEYQNIVACQFHPEKSGDFGIEILRRWLQC